MKAIRVGAVILFFQWVLMTISVTASETIHTFQYDGSSYTSVHDLRIRGAEPYTESCGASLVVNTINQPLIQFYDLDVPAGIYSVELQLTAKDITGGTSALVSIEFLNETSWSDPHSYIVTPATDSTYPTWNYVNYSSVEWESPGASDPSERGALLGKQIISSVSEPYSYYGAATIQKKQTALAFIATVTSEANIWFCCQENVGDSYFLNPKLILTGPRARGGLDRNLFSEPYKPLR